MKKLFPTLVALVLTGLLFAGCAGVNFDYADAKKITVGMTTDQVVSTMKTKPYVTEVHGDETDMVWVYGNLLGQVKQVRVRFDKDGHVIAAPVVP